MTGPTPGRVTGKQAKTGGLLPRGGLVPYNALRSPQISPESTQTSSEGKSHLLVDLNVINFGAMHYEPLRSFLADDTAVCLMVTVVWLHLQTPKGHLCYRGDSLLELQDLMGI